MDLSRRWYTPRLTLRPLCQSDLDGMRELHGDPEAMRFLNGVWSEQQTSDILQRIIANYAASDLEWLAVADRQSNRFIGCCWVGPLGRKWCDAIGEGPLIELGYRYVRHAWGQGYATEAARAMLQRGFGELNLKEIVAIVDSANYASDRVLAKLGLIYRRPIVAKELTIKYYGLTQSAYRAIAASASTTT
jgi:RimJ/RimL family protein N-acetyltransferase